MEFNGFRLEMPRWPKMEFVFTRNPATEDAPPHFKLNNDQRNIPPLQVFTDLRVVVIEFDHILRIYAGTKNGVQSLAINVVVPTGRSTPPQYGPFTYNFIPASYDLQKLVELLNYYVFGEPAPKPLRFKVFINMKAGKGKAGEIFQEKVKPILKAAGCDVRYGMPRDDACTRVVYTTGPNFAKTEVSGMALGNYDAIMCVGGDGLVHEVVNGLASHKDGLIALKTMTIATIPAGSGNAMTASLFGDCDPSYAAWQAVNNTHMMVDLMSLTSIGDDRPPLWLFLSVSFGWIAHADLGTEKMRWAGNIRFSAGAAYQVMFKKEYKCSVAIHGAQAPPADVNADAITQRAAIKTQLRDFYNERYNRRQVDYIHTELPKDGNIGDIIDSNLPMDKWQHATYEQMNCFYAGKAPWVSKEACAFPTALANDGYIDVCMLSGASFMGGFQILHGFDQGLHFNHPTISYQKVKAFKLIPGIRYQGDDTENLNKDATPPQIVHKVPRRPDREVNGKKFSGKYYLSVDGERYEAGHGVVCEVHQGLARFTCDSKLEKYQPTTLHQGNASQTAATVRRVLDEANPNSEGNLTFDQWLSMWESRLGGWKLQHMASNTV